MSKIASLIFGALTLIFMAAPAAAQSGCQYIAAGAVLTPAQWNFCFQQKVDITAHLGTPSDFPVYSPADNGLVDSGIYLAPAGGVNLYASPTGNDSANNCLASNAPCTLKGACVARNQIATFLSGGFNIYLANGTYSAVDGNNALCTIIGNSGGSSPALTNIIGNSSSPTSVVLAVPAGDYGIYGKDGGQSLTDYLEITGGNGSTGIECAGQGSICDYNTISWGTWGNAGSHVAVGAGAYVNLLSSGETMLANYVYHWNMSGAASLSAGGPTSIPSAIAGSGGYFLNAVGAGWNANLGSWSTTGSGVSGTTGAKCNLAGPGYLTTPGNGTANSTFPGNQNCQFLSGAQDSAGDPTAVPSTTYSNLPGTIAGYFVRITDGKANQCGDSSCTTWGTTVTGGGGSLNLLLWANGTNYTLVGK